MVKILKAGKKKRTKRFYKVECPYCGAMLAFERADIWIDDPDEKIGRIECAMPGCKMKIHMAILDDPSVAIANAISEDEYDKISSDTSKSGLQMMIEEGLKRNA